MYRRPPRYTMEAWGQRRGKLLVPRGNVRVEADAEAGEVLCGDVRCDEGADEGFEGGRLAGWYLAGWDSALLGRSGLLFPSLPTLPVTLFQPQNAGKVHLTLSRRQTGRFSIPLPIAAQNESKKCWRVQSVAKFPHLMSFSIGLVSDIESPPSPMPALLAGIWSRHWNCIQQSMDDVRMLTNPSKSSDGQMRFAKTSEQEAWLKKCPK
ncbi:hypothetical protein K505DRAFT_374816 [Melanomma pulvis-pyrius CBS 109.77]|uniref:Uncharacterized protein n=1 Tax=Melanomma pulvis-pyrius CBS 109.77 TaxID=1314802 RepID=A0A6A6XE34_9PLEO|nr:hypothetical protein K505DRAFT_374816 [Melanomma pulvis-pyrius CBS 109.77]